MAGFELQKVETDERDNIDVAHLREMVDDDTAGLMLTNPSTLGLFDEHIDEIAEIFHEAGALLYYDGANLNAVCGISRPGDMGFDIVHFNLHKTFSQPHGGGGLAADPSPCAIVSSPSCPFRQSSARGTTSGSTTRGQIDRQGARLLRPVRGLRPRTRTSAPTARAYATCPRWRC